MNVPPSLVRLWTAYRYFSEHDGPLVAAGLAYYVALSFFPLLLVMVAGLSYALQGTARGQDAQQQILAALEQQASPALSDYVREALATAGVHAPAGGAVGFAILVVTAIAMFTQVDYAFDRIWRLPTDHPPTWLRWIGRLLLVRFKALIMLMGAGGLVIAAMVASVVWSGVQAMVAERIAINPWWTWAAGFSISVSLNFLAFALMYRYLPKAKIRPLEAIDGAIVAAALWEVGRQVLTLYLWRQNYTAAYGVTGSFLAIMLWAYYGMMVALFGAEFVRVLHLERIARDQAATGAGGRWEGA